MRPVENEFYNAVDRLQKDRDVARNERDCYKSKCVELRDENENLKAEAQMSEARNSNLANIMYKQDRTISHLKDELRTKDHQLNSKIAQNLQLNKKLAERDAEIEELKALLENQNKTPPSNAELVRGEHSTLYGDSSDRHKSDS